MNAAGPATAASPSGMPQKYSSRSHDLEEKSSYAHDFLS
jgi:hypothetical protein